MAEEMEKSEQVQEIVLDKNFKIVETRGRLFQTRGYLKAFEIGDSLENVLTKFWNEDMAARCRLAIEKAKTFKRVYKINPRRRNPLSISITIEPRVERGRIVGAVFRARDITRETRQEYQQALREKMSQLSILAAQIADRLNNPLASVLNRIGYLLVDDFANLDFSHLRRELESIQDQLYSMSLITNALQSFSRESPADFRPLQINEVLSKTIDISKLLQIQGNINYIIDLADNLPLVFGSEITLEQAFLNIIRNALEAMPEGGVLSVSSCLDEVTGKHVLISIKDNGEGISQENLARVFDPFFKTKNDSHPGLGLSISYGIITSHKGHIEIMSKKTKGTKVIVLLPIVD